MVLRFLAVENLPSHPEFTPRGPPFNLRHMPRFNVLYETDLGIRLEKSNSRALHDPHPLSRVQLQEYSD
jgi:hypothetical protein